MKDTDDAVLATLEEHVLRPEVVTGALREAVARLKRPAGAQEAERERLLRTLARLTAELARFTEALVSDGNLPSIVAALTEREAQRSRLEQQLAALDELEQVRGFDLQRVEPDLRAKLDDWRGLLSRNVAQARQALRSLVPARLTFTPKEEEGERFYMFEGMAVLDRFLAGIVLPKALVAPTGFEPVFQGRRDGFPTGWKPLAELRRAGWQSGDHILRPNLDLSTAITTEGPGEQFYVRFPLFLQRARAALRAISRRLSGDTPSHRALPPLGPPVLPPRRQA